MKTLKYNGTEYMELLLDRDGNLYYSKNMKQLKIYERTQSYSPVINKKKITIQKKKALYENFPEIVIDSFIASISKKNEEWKQYSSDIYASNLGKICNVKTLSVLNPVVDKERGYDRVRIKDKLISVHRIVAELFVQNEDPNRFNIVNHIDGNKTNNHYSNLEWCDNSKNIKHAYDSFLKTSTGKTVLTEEIVREARKMFLEGRGINDISKELGFNRNTISAAINKKSWKQVV